jgi:hypothetical protein
MGEDAVSITVESLRLMEAKGLSFSDAIEILAAMEVRRDPTAAERQQRHRDKVRAERDAVTRDVTRDDESKKKSPQTPKEKTTPLNGSLKGEPIPPDAEPIVTPEVRPEHVLEAWNDMASRTGVPKAKPTPERQRKLRTFIRRHRVDEITEAIAAVERSPFLRGENDRSWKADFNWMLEPRNFTKLTEGTYDR